MKKREKGFTLIELVGVVVILAVIGFVVYPIINGLLVNNKEQIYERQIEQLEKIASNWVITNSGQIVFEDNATYYLYLDDLYEQGYIEENELYNPKTNEPLTGCITITWREQINQHIYNYDPECNVLTLPGIALRTDDGVVNSNGWAKEDFIVYIEGRGLDNYAYCVSDSKCEPDVVVNAGSGSVGVNTEGTKYICAYGKNNLGTTATICKEYKLDKTKPAIGTINVVGALGLNDYYVSNVEVSHTNSTDALSGIESETFTPLAGIVDYDTEGITYTLTATDKAGNSDTVSHTIKVDVTKPENGVVVFNGTLGSNDWYTSDVTVTLNSTEEYVMSSNISSITENTDGTTVTVTTTDKAGNTNPKDYVIKVDKTKPTVGAFDIVGTEGENGWYISDVTISGTGGSDDISGPVTTTVDVSSITSDTKGTMVTLTTTNQAGLTSTDTTTIKVDKTKPTVGTFDIVGTEGENGWYTSNVTISAIDGSDSISGHESSSVDVSSITTNTEGTTVTLTTKNGAGLTSTDTVTIKVDKVTPTLTAKNASVEIVAGTSVDTKTYFNTPTYGKSKQASYTCNVANTSNLAVGTHTITCTAKAKNGLSATAGISLIVKTTANPPILFTNMIPVTYNTTTSKWKYADISQEWYNYGDKEWANAVILKKSPSKSYSVGNDIEMSDIAQMYVWIPRYKYTIFNGNNGSVNEQLISVTFEQGTSTTGTVKCYDAVSGTAGTSSEVCTDSTNGSIKNGTSTYTHPAFCLGRKNANGSCNGTELTGIWVGKFETSGRASAANLTVLPNEKSLVETTVSEYFTAMGGVASSFNVKDENNILADSHMMKNMEWGAVAYLKQSEYGLGTTDIALNNYNNLAGTSYPRFMTGCGSAVGTTDITATCEAYDTSNGMRASTTGNIYGVYDMSGGAREYVMGNMVNTAGKFNYSSGGQFSPAEKYYDAYTYYGSNGYTKHGRGKLGDATKETLKTFGNETGGWYSDGSRFPSSIIAGQPFSWFYRGGYSDTGANAGIFQFSGDSGSDTYVNSARLVISHAG